MIYQNYEYLEPALPIERLIHQICILYIVVCEKKEEEEKKTESKI